MIETRATVVAVEPGYAWLEAERRSSCSHCSSGDQCGVSAVSRLFGERRQRIRVVDHLGLETGGQVLIGLSEQRLLVAAMLAYLVPLLFMITGALAGSGLGMGPAASVLPGLAGLGVGLWFAGRQTRRLSVRDNLQPVLLRQFGVPHYNIEFKP